MRPFDYPIILAVVLLAGWHVRHKLRERREDRASQQEQMLAGQRPEPAGPSPSWVRIFSPSSPKR